MASKNQLQKFILNTDYASLKSFPQTITITINLPAGNIIGANNYLITHTYITPTSFVLPKGAPIQSTISYSINPTFRWVGNNLDFVENAGASNQYQGFIYVYMSAQNEIGVDVVRYNSNATGVSTVARTAIVTVRTFISPFS